MDNKLSSLFPSSQHHTIETEQFHAVLREEINGDTIIPDTMADVEKILLCTATTKILGKFPTDSGIEIDGSVTYQVLLATENNTLSQLSVTEPFQTKVSCPFHTEEAQILIFPSIYYTTARLINPRKVNLRSQTDMDLHILVPVLAEPDISGAETLDDDMNLLRKHRTIKAIQTESFTETDLPVHLDLELDSHYPSVDEILSSQIRMRPAEIRARGEEADVRTDAIVSVIYRTAEGNYFVAEKKFPLETAVTVPFHEGCVLHASATPSLPETDISTNSYGEMKVIELNFSYDLTVTCQKNHETETVSDMYSTEFPCDLTFSSLQTQQFRRAYATNLSVNASTTREESMANQVRNVFCGSVALKDVATKYLPEKNKICIEGTAKIDLVCENNILLETEELFSTVCFDYPFKCELDAGECFETMTLHTDCGITDIRFRADSQKLYCDFELAMRLTASEPLEVTYVQNVSLNRDASLPPRVAPLTLCYPTEGETLWDIAKQYCVACEEISELNQLSGEELENKKVLLIPRSKPRRAVFSKVV